MTISCDMAMDLIALYNDGVASEDTRRAVREHLRSCPSCAKAYANYSEKRRKERVRQARSQSSAELSAKYASLAKDLRKKHLIKTAVVISVMTFSVAVGSFCAIKLLCEKGLDAIVPPVRTGAQE